MIPLGDHTFCSGDFFFLLAPFHFARHFFVGIVFSRAQDAGGSTNWAVTRQQLPPLWVDKVDAVEEDVRLIQLKRECTAPFGSVRCSAVRCRDWFGSVRFGSIRFGSVRFSLVRFSLARFGFRSVWFSSVLFCSVLLGSVRSELARFGSVRLYSVRFRSVRSHSTQFDSC